MQVLNLLESLILAEFYKKFNFKLLETASMVFAILIAMNLQSSFLTPPFGFSLFYLRGVAPKSVTTIDIYKGVIPFILIQVSVLAMMVFFPHIFGF